MPPCISLDHPQRPSCKREKIAMALSEETPKVCELHPLPR